MAHNLANQQNECRGGGFHSTQSKRKHCASSGHVLLIRPPRKPLINNKNNPLIIAKNPIQLNY